MNDLIDRKSALLCFHNWTDKDGNIHEANNIPEYRAIEMLPIIEPRHKWIQRWIPCYEQLPFVDFFNKSNYVLCTCCFKENYSSFNSYWLEILYFDGKDWYYQTGEKYWNKVVAWMTLPNPYDEE